MITSIKNSCGRNFTRNSLKVKALKTDFSLVNIKACKKIQIAQVAPAVRVAIGEPFGINLTDKQLVTVLKKIGFDYVFDTTFTADLTIIEEANELLHRLKHNGKLPMFTSCCPGWIQLAEQSFPEIVDNISTCKSPQLMMGSIIKHYFSQKINYHPNDMFMVSFMPCVRKQSEADRLEGDTTGFGPDVDVVVTTNELAKSLKEMDIVIDDTIHETEFDKPFGTGTGSSLLFGRTGGVMVAALRYVYKIITGDELKDVKFVEKEGIKTADICMKPKDGGDNIIVKIAIIVGLGDVKKFIKNVLSGDKDANSYHFIEIMACAPLGCVGGGGQPPIGKNKILLENRKNMLNNIDTDTVTKDASENIDIDHLYNDFLQKPCGQISHHLLHKNKHVK